jgi:hypothetical protein
MTSVLSRRSAAAPVDLAQEGIHRDPVSHDPISSAPFTQRLVEKASAMFGSRTSRRSFLTKTAVIGSALAVGPIDFLLKPGTAYGYVCGSCGDGWTAFCCTINNGRNSCPPYSFVAGWWKADNAAYCCGAARYIIDCNATCPTQCSCRCAGASCDDRRTCCNQFRYGQCHTEISCYGPVVCRVATCTPPWKYDPSCTTSSATDNKTVNHGAPCLGTDCGTPIAKKYAALGGASGFLGAVTTPEQPLADGRGRRARYKGGNIYWTATTGAHEVHGAILTEYGTQGGASGILGYPKSDTLTSSDSVSRYSNFEKGRIYYLRGSQRTFTVPNPFFTKHESVGGVHGVLGYPKSDPTAFADHNGAYQSFSGGRIYNRSGRVTEIHGAFFVAFDASGGSHGPLGVPTDDQADVGDGIGRKQHFERGAIWYSSATGARPLYGPISDAYAALGGARGFLRYPTASITAVGDGSGTYGQFQGGRIYRASNAATAAYEVHGAIQTAWLNTYGGPTGQLGYPTGNLKPRGTVPRTQTFEHGTLEYHDADGTVTLVP